MLSLPLQKVIFNCVCVFKQTSVAVLFYVSQKNNTSQASFVVRVLFSNTNMFRGGYVSLSTLTEKQTICFLVLYFNNKQFLASTCPYFVCTNLAFHNKNNRNHFGKKLKKQNKFEEEIERRNHFGEDNNNK